ncbi:MAG: c-type cytochrome [Flavobacteriales bacterium]|jgi:mono/diheme cytochrome c family protein
MRTLLKFMKWVGIILVLLVAGLVITILSTHDKTYEAPYPDIHASTDSAVIARGRYLAYGPAHCSGCHSPLSNWERIAAGEELPLEGGFAFALPVGNFYPANLTPHETGIGKMTDPEIARALRHGVGHDGRPLIEIMPFHNLSEEDLTAVISFLRTQPPVERATPKNEPNFMGKAVFAFVIKPVGPEGNGEVAHSVTPDTTAAYGEYLANFVANCRGCHTNRDLKTGAYIGEYYSGGFLMPSAVHPGMACMTPNLTPDPETGHIADWSEVQFIERFRAGRIIPSSEMPWEQFQRMSHNDLKAIYRYIQTLKPVQNEVKTIVHQLAEQR